MIKIKLSLYFLCLVLMFSACGSDDPDDDMSEKECKIIDVYLNLNETTRLGLLPISYNDQGQVSVSDIQDIAFTYDADGNVASSLLSESVGVPKVETTFTYENNRLVSARQIWDDNFSEPRFIYELFYDGEYLDSVLVSGLFPDEVLDFDFDSNGNVLKYTGWVFNNVINYTYDTANKGIFNEPLEHSKALAYSIGTLSQFWFWNNAVSTVEEDGTELTFTNQYNDQGLLIEALTGDDDYEYSFDYECE